MCWNAKVQSCLEPLNDGAALSGAARSIASKRNLWGEAMSVRLGVGVLDLLPQTSSLALQVPDDIVEQLSVLTILDHRATTSTNFVLHEGTLQAPLAALSIDTTSWPFQIPGVTEGLPFRLAIQRGAVIAGQEASPALWTLDIEVTDVEVQIPGVRAAQQTGGTGVTALTLQPVQGSDKARKVFLVACGVVRISGGGSRRDPVQSSTHPTRSILARQPAR